MESVDTAGSEDQSKKSPFDELSREELIKKCKGLLVIAQKAKQAKTDLQGEVESYKLQLEKCESEKVSSEKSVKTLTELVDSLTEQKLIYITEIDAAKNKVKSLSDTCSALEGELANYRESLVEKDKQIAVHSAALYNFDSENTSLKRQNKRLADENEQLITQLTELEAQIAELNKIGLEQREQLRMIEKKMSAAPASEDNYESRTLIDELKSKLLQLQRELQTKEDVYNEYQKTNNENEQKIKQLNQMYETEKEGKEKANNKLRSYREKILKCATCINQLKNSRYILTKTVQEYSESIPKWQKEIIKASKFLDKQLTEMSNENIVLKEKLKELEKRINDFTVPQEENKTLTASLHQNIHALQNSNEKLQSEINDIKPQYDELKNNILPKLTDEYNVIKNQYEDLTKTIQTLKWDNAEIKNTVKKLEEENNLQQKELAKYAEVNINNKAIDSLNMHIKALESEKATLLKEKLNAKDSVMDLDKQNKTLNDQVEKLQNDLHAVSNELTILKQEKEMLMKKFEGEEKAEASMLKCELMQIQEHYKLLKQEHDTLLDINSLLKEEVETLKLSLEQPKDADTSDLTVSLQADIAKLQNKLSNYKQENASLLAEIKESRARMKEVDLILSDYEDAKIKLSGYKTENAELLNEMKEINQVLKERGENISKLQKAISEMERLVETLEKDRDKANQEKDSLLKKVAVMENDLRIAEQKTNDNMEATDKIILERNNAMKSVAEKELLIASLKEEIEYLKQHQGSGNDLPNEDISTSTISKADDHSRMKDLDESFEDKYTKLRIFALKLKKRLNETTCQLQETEQDKAKLEKMLQERSNVGKDCVDGVKQVQIVQISELEEKVATLSDALAASEKQVTEVESLKAELAVKAQELASEIEAHKTTKEHLERARKEVKKKSVLSLEMEDYERSMKELTVKMEENRKKIIQMESTIDTQEGTIMAMKTQIKLLEEQIKNEENQNRLTKEELHRVIEDVREKDNTIQMKTETINKLEQDLEDEKRRIEELSVDMTSLLGEKEKSIMALGEEKVELNSRLKRVEFSCADLREKLRITNIELEDLKTEYTSYKVRAQAVLRQNQTVDHSQEELLKEETAALRTQIESLTAKLNASQEECNSQRAAAEQERRRSGEAANEAARATQRTARLQADLARLAAQLDAERAHHKLQMSTLTQCYKTQITDLESRLAKETEELRRQLEKAQEKVHSTLALDTMNKNVFVPISPKEDSESEMDINVTMLPREEGEGSEAAPSPPLSKSFITAGGGNRSPVPLERLLEEGVPDDESLDTSALSLSLSPEQELVDLRRKLHAQQQRVKHVTVLLSESERECARLSQLSELLKAEVRRARGSLERSGHAHNAEYLKNVTIKFLTLPPGDERSRLVPVLQKILALSPTETQQINAVAKGMDPNPSKGWGSYLPWPGGK